MSERPRVGAKPWFGPKRIAGWGWSPSSWEGWLVLFVYIGGILVPMPFLRDGTSAVYVAWIAILTVVLLVCCVLKGTSPGGPADYDRYA